MISFKEVTKKYGPKIIALQDVSFEVTDGEFLFIVGPSGAGKTTIVRLILRTEIPTKGKISFNNINVITMEPNMIPAYRQQFGIVFQDDKLLYSKTVRENIEFALEITGKTDKEIKETADYLLDVTKLTDRAHLFPHQLSGGEKQRAGMARALANDPKIFVADEPTGDLDPDNADEILEIMDKINKWGTTVIVATHNKDLVDRKQTRVIRLEDGQIISDEKGGYGKSAPKKKAKLVKPKKSKKSTKGDTSKISAQKSASDGKIEDLDLNKDIKKILIKGKIKKVDQLLDMAEDDLKKIKGISSKNVEEIMRSLKKIINK
jgi:cell division transport system ATP-binding protein